MTSRHKKPFVMAPDALPYRMRLLVQLMGRDFQVVLKPYDITPLHWGVLSCLWERDGLAIQEIARRLEQLAGTLTVGLSAMEERRLIQRKADGADGRVWRIWLTEKGKKLKAALTPKVTTFVDEMFACLTTAEYEALEKMTVKLQRHMEGRSVGE